MFTNEMLQEHVKSGETSIDKWGDTRRMPAKAIKCNDGFTISIQASETHYCSPRNYEGPYSKVELGFPSVEDETITEYAEDIDNLTGTVYGYVPVSTVVQLINKHGGLTKTDL